MASTHTAREWYELLWEWQPMQINLLVPSTALCGTHVLPICFWGTEGYRGLRTAVSPTDLLWADRLKGLALAGSVQVGLLSSTSLSLCCCHLNMGKLALSLSNRGLVYDCRNEVPAVPLRHQRSRPRASAGTNQHSCTDCNWCRGHTEWLKA